MIRFTKEHLGEHEVVIRVEGRLDSGAVGDFGALLAGIVPSVMVHLDLDGVTSIDGESRDFLVAASRRGVRLRGGSLYINRLLEEASQ